MIGLLRPAPHVAPLPLDRVDPEYKRLRRRVFAGIFVGYAGYYLVRNNLALAIPDLLAEHPEYSKAELGTALTGLSIAYGLSKFLMGSVSDRSNPKYFLPLGLAALERADGGVRPVRGLLRLAHRDHRRHGRQRLGAGHGLAAQRQDHGALVQHAGARAGSSRPGTSRTTSAVHWSRTSRSSASSCSRTGARSSISMR